MKFVKGDTQAFKFKITTKDGEDVERGDISALLITCKKAPSDNSPVIFQKTLEDVTLEDGYYHAVFAPEDTQSLPIGKYYFDIEVTLARGYRKTKLVAFELTAETTVHGGSSYGN